MSEADSEVLALEKVADRVVRKWNQLELPEPVECETVHSAHRYLAAARDSVGLTMLNMRLSREFTKAIDKKGPAGRLTNMEMDLLRAAIVFAGAGLDATLKELIRCALPVVVRINTMARDKFRRFAAEYLGSKRQGLDFDELASVLVAPTGPRDALLEKYAIALTGESLQSAAQVSNTAGALGISDERLRKRLTANSELDLMFRARNQIVHELDLTPNGLRSRRIDETTRWVTEALGIGQAIVNAVAEEIRKSA
jgi:hypothetical protein